MGIFGCAFWVFGLVLGITVVFVVIFGGMGIFFLKGCGGGGLAVWACLSSFVLCDLLSGLYVILF
jgi:hypothetical protein